MGYVFTESIFKMRRGETGVAEENFRVGFPHVEVDRPTLSLPTIPGGGQSRPRAGE